MDSFEWNKIFMGVGFSVLGVLGINELSKAIYDVPEPTESAYVVAGVQAEASPGDAGAPKEEAMPDFGTVLASADVAAGEKVMGKCAQCHTWDKGGANKVGPNLYGVVGNHHAHLGDGFAYSKAMLEKSGETWDYAALYHFLASPKAAIPGTKMGFAGLPKSEDRINVLAYLRTQSDSPLAIPAPNPAAPAAPAAPGAAPAAPGAEPAKPEGSTTPATPPAAAPTTPPAAPATPPTTPPAAPSDTPATPPAAPATSPASPPETPAGPPAPEGATPAPATPPAGAPETPPAGDAEPGGTDTTPATPPAKPSGG